MHEIQSLIWGLMFSFILGPILSIIALSPAVIPILLVKKITNQLSPKMQNAISIFSIAFFTPFLNFLYFVSLNEVIPLFIGAWWLFIILPLIIIVTLISSIVQKKIHFFILLTCFLMYIFGVVFLFTGLYVVEQQKYDKESTMLLRYNSVITQIKSQKSKTGHYPKDIKALKIPEDGGYEVINYETKENGKDFIFTVKDSEYALEFFSYCSNPKYEECHAHETYPMEYIQRGEWVKGINHD